MKIIIYEDWRSANNVLLYKGKGEMSECKNYRGISLSMVEKIYAEISVDSAHTETEGLIDNENGGFQVRERVYGKCFY